MERERDVFFSERGAKSPTKEEILRSSERPGGDDVGWIERERVQNPNFERAKNDDSDKSWRSKSNALNRLSEI